MGRQISKKLFSIVVSVAIFFVISLAGFTVVFATRNRGLRYEMELSKTMEEIRKEKGHQTALFRGVANILDSGNEYRGETLRTILAIQHNDESVEEYGETLLAELAQQFPDFLDSENYVAYKTVNSAIHDRIKEKASAYNKTLADFQTWLTKIPARYLYDTEESYKELDENGSV